MTEKFVVRVLMVPVMLIAGVLWAGIGLFSPYQLGVILEKTGRNLQEYSW